MRRLTDVWYNSIWAWIAVACMATAIQFFVDPDAPRATTRALGHNWAYAWNLLYGVGGLSLWIGELRTDRRDLVFTGLVMVGFGIVINVIAAIATSGLSTFVPINLALLISIVGRATHLLKGKS